MVLDKRLLSVFLLLVAGLLTVYVSLLAATASVAQEDVEPTNINEEPLVITDPDVIDNENDLIDAQEDLMGTEETLPLLTPVSPLEVDQELDQDVESGEGTPAAPVYNTGDGYAVCAPIQQTPVTGNQQTGQGNLGVGSDDAPFGGPDLALAPEQDTACAQPIQPTS